MLRLPRILRAQKQVNTLITMEGRTGDHRRQPQTTQQPEPLTEHGGSQSAAPATNSAHGGSQSAAPATNSAHGGSQSAAPATNSARQETSEYSNQEGRTGDHRRQPQTTQQPEPLTEHGGSQSAAPATNSARQETSEYSNQEGRTGDHRRQPQTTADNATARASNGAWRFTKCCACHEFCASRNK